MSRETCASRIMGRNSSRITQSEGNENEFENPTNVAPFPPLRTPLNAIQDPSLNPRETVDNSSDSRVRFPEKKTEALVLEQRFTECVFPSNKGTGVVVSNYTPPRAARGKANSEPSSAQSTPARSISRVPNVGSSGVNTVGRPPQHSGPRGGSFSKVSKAVSNVMYLTSVEVPTFELVEDSSFWMDHNVQVLIRIRPISSAEKALQGCSRCLRQESAQSLTWLGHPETRFTFDHIASETISQEKLFKVAGLPMVENCMSGYNSCMFAYGQTGSGKTYTMMGEIYEIDNKLSDDCGMTPRIFEYLFMRITAEEEKRKDEKLKYRCKCSFLEIYNEQITDLLEPSSTNLQLREDLKQGVYVENLTEYEVTAVKDVVELLVQGAANRKMAATNMNSESSRSHSVFTCVIESRWEKDSMTHLRFGRLNLVDLAGSERQKSSGAEGERLKEAANINKSLSTLGLVIMSLVDLAHGKHRHVPYRDSRLTFLLQDSLGGNSKTTIIANVSPSICAVNETLSTLKFAQRAKLIQNNAKVNEDASGDVMALQQQIHQLKNQLSNLLKHQNIPRPLSFCLSCLEQGNHGDLHEDYCSSVEENPSTFEKKIKYLQATLVGSLRREKIEQNAVRRLEAEIEHMNHLVHQREEDAQRTKIMLRFREEKIRRLELLADGLVYGEEYLMEENNALSEEIQLLQARIDQNPELTRFALENIRLIEQLRMFQDFYEQGEREMLLAEISELRDQVDDSRMESEDCKKNLDAPLDTHARLSREVESLQCQLKEHLSCKETSHRTVEDFLPRNNDTIRDTHKVDHSLLTDSEGKTAPCRQVEGKLVFIANDQKASDAVPLEFIDVQKELMDQRSLVEAMKHQQILLIEELDNLREKNSRYQEIFRSKDHNDMQLLVPLDTHSELSQRQVKAEELGHQDADEMNKCLGIKISALQSKLERMHKGLEEARILNIHYSLDQASQLSHQQQFDQVCEEVEVETAKTILHLQEELGALQQEINSRAQSESSVTEHLLLLRSENQKLQDRLCIITEENILLQKALTARDGEISVLSEEWEKAISDLTSFLVHGCQSLEDASDQIQGIASSFPHKKCWISEQVVRVVNVSIEREKMIAHLQKRLQKAHKLGLEMKLKLSSLKGATLAISEIQQLENNEDVREVVQLRDLLHEKTLLIHELEIKLQNKENQITQAEKCASSALVTIKRLHETKDADSDLVMHSKNNQRDDAMKEVHGSEIRSPLELDKSITPGIYADGNSETLREILAQLELERQRVSDFENAICASSADIEKNMSTLLSDILDASSVVGKMVHDLIYAIGAIKKELMDLKVCIASNSYSRVGTLPSEACQCMKLENELGVTRLVRRELAKANEKLKILKAGIGTLSTFNRGLLLGRDSFVANEHNSVEFKIPVEKLIDIDKSGIYLTEIESMLSCLVDIYVQLCMLLDVEEMAECSYAQERQSLQLHADKDKHSQLAMQEMGQIVQMFDQQMQRTEAGSLKTREMLRLKLNDSMPVAEDKMKQTGNFFKKLEEAQETMKEADLVLNAMLKVNGSTKHSNERWKQPGTELVVERDTLIREVQQLKASMHLQKDQYELLLDQIHSHFVEIMNSVSSLKRYFLQVQSNMEKEFKTTYSDVFSLGRELLDFIGTSKSWREDVCSEIMEKDFSLFVLYHCYAAAYSEKVLSSNADSWFPSYEQREHCSLPRNFGNILVDDGGDLMQFSGMNDRKEGILIDHSKYRMSASRGIHELPNMCTEEKADMIALPSGNEEGQTDFISENLFLKRELAWKDSLLEGLFFDFKLLQESTSNAKDLKDQRQDMVAALSQARLELAMKTTELDNILVPHRELETCLVDRDVTVSSLKSELEMLTNENAEQRVLLEDLCIKKTNAEDQLEETKMVVKDLEEEILRLASFVEARMLCSIEEVEDDLKSVSNERDQLRAEVISLNDKLNMSKALADENEAIAVEARQMSEASKIYAEQKEEEAKILEHSVEELECTVNVLEKKVFEMGEEVERHRLMRENLELELQALRYRMLTVENVTENLDSENSNVEETSEQQMSRNFDRIIELSEAKKCIQILDKERAQQAEEIKRMRDYISELVLHSEAQASQYQQKFKYLESMVHETKTDYLASHISASTTDKTERSMTRTRRSSSPFKCIANVVQQMNFEKDQELSIARLQIEELETLAATCQKEVCMLTARLAATENMTHDVIRDLLGVKLDITNYANLMDQQHFRKLAEKVLQQTEEINSKNQEILKLRKHVNDFIEERESWSEEINQRQSDMLAAQVRARQLQERDQLLRAQNEMLKMDKANLTRKVLELDETVKKLVGS